MATRFNSRLYSRTNYGQPALPTVFDAKIDAGFNVQPCGIEDLEVGLFNLFEKEIKLQVSPNNRKVPIIFASGEKWALLKKNAAFRDKNDSLILPLVTIVRNSYSQDQTDIAARGINQMQGEIIVQRRLSPLDREYQNLVNRQGIKHQKNAAVKSSEDPYQLTTERTQEDLTEDPAVLQGGLLTSNRQKNVVETIAIPTPQFFSATYEVTIWAQYIQQMNQIIEKIVSSYLPQTQGWRIETSKGYWFIATVDGTSWASDNNTDDMSGVERVLKQKFTITAAAYVLASNTPGAPVPVKKYVSYPEISFGLSVEDQADTTSDEPFLGSDDPTLPLAHGSERSRKDLRKTGTERLFVQNNEIKNPNDPAPSSAVYAKVMGADGKVRYVRTNAQGEVVLRNENDYLL